MVFSPLSFPFPRKEVKEGETKPDIVEEGGEGGVIGIGGMSFPFDLRKSRKLAKSLAIYFFAFLLSSVAAMLSIVQPIVSLGLNAGFMVFILVVFIAFIIELISMCRVGASENDREDEEKKHKRDMMENNVKVFMIIKSVIIMCFASAAIYYSMYPTPAVVYPTGFCLMLPNETCGFFTQVFLSDSDIRICRLTPHDRVIFFATDNYTICMEEDYDYGSGSGKFQFYSWRRYINDDICDGRICSTL